MRRLCRGRPRLIHSASIACLALVGLVQSLPLVEGRIKPRQIDETDWYLLADGLDGDLSLFARGDLPYDHRPLASNHVLAARTWHDSGDESEQVWISLDEVDELEEEDALVRTSLAKDEFDAELDEQENEPLVEEEKAFLELVRRQTTNTATFDLSQGVTSTGDEGPTRSPTGSSSPPRVSTSSRTPQQQLTPTSTSTASSTSPSSSPAEPQPTVTSRSTSPSPTSSARPSSSSRTPRSTSSKANPAGIPSTTSSSAVSATSPSTDNTSSNSLPSPPAPSSVLTTSRSAPSAAVEAFPLSESSSMPAEASTTSAAPPTVQSATPPPTPSSSDPPVPRTLGILFGVLAAASLLSAAIVILAKRARGRGVSRISTFSSEGEPVLHPRDSIRIIQESRDAPASFVVEMHPGAPDAFAGEGPPARGNLTRRKRSIHSANSTPTQASTALRPIFEYPLVDARPFTPSRRSSSIMSDATATAGSYEDYNLAPSPVVSVTRKSSTTLNQSTLSPELTPRETRKALMLAVKAQLGGAG